MAKLSSGRRPLDMPTFLKPEQMDFEKRNILLSSLLKQLKMAAIPRIVSGDLTAGAANAFAFSWQNPESFKLIILGVFIEITTNGGTAGSVIDVGTAIATETHGDNLIDGGNLNTIGFLYSAGDYVKVDEKGGTTDWITGQILVADALNLVGKYYIHYIRR